MLRRPECWTRQVFLPCVVGAGLISTNGQGSVFLADTFVGAVQPADRRILRQIMAGAQQDSYLAEAVADFTATRRHELRVLLERGRQRGEITSRVTESAR